MNLKYKLKCDAEGCLFCSERSKRVMVKDLPVMSVVQVSKRQFTGSNK